MATPAREDAAALKCSVCDETFSSRNKLMKHIKTHTTENQEAKQNTVEEKPKGKPPRKPRNCRKNMSFGCELCGKMFEKERYLDMHLESSHATEPKTKREACERCERPANVCLCPWYCIPSSFPQFTSYLPLRCLQFPLPCVPPRCLYFASTLPPLASMLPLCYLHFTSVLPPFYLHFTSILPPFYLQFASISRHFPHFTLILPRFNPSYSLGLHNA